MKIRKRYGAYVVFLENSHDRRFVKIEGNWFAEDSDLMGHTIYEVVTPQYAAKLDRASEKYSA